MNSTNVSLRRMMLFCGNDGRSVIVRPHPCRQNSVFISNDDGKTYYEVLVRHATDEILDSGATSGWHSQETGIDWLIEVYEPHRQAVHVIRLFVSRDAPEMTFDGAKFTNKPCPRQIDVVPVPMERTASVVQGVGAHMFSSPSGNCVLYHEDSAWSFSFSPDGVKFFQILLTDFGGSSDQTHQSSTFESPHHGQTFNLLRDSNTVILDGEVIGRTRVISRTIPVPDDTSKPFITAYGDEFVLDEQVLKKHNLTPDDVVENKLGNIRRLHNGGRRAILVIGGDILTSSEVPTTVTYVHAPVVRAPLHLYRLDNGDFVYLSFEKYGRISRYDCNTDSVKLFVGPADNLRHVPAGDIVADFSGLYITVKTDEGTFVNYSPDEQNAPSWRGLVLQQLDLSQYRFMETNDSVRINQAG